MTRTRAPRIVKGKCIKPEPRTIKGKRPRGPRIIKGIRIYEMCHEITGLSVPKIEIPLAFGYLGIPFDKLKAILLRKEPLVTSESLGALKTMMELDNRKAVNELGFSPRKMEETLRDIYIWFIENNFINLKEEKGLTKEKCELLIGEDKEVYFKAG